MLRFLAAAAEMRQEQLPPVAMSMPAAAKPAYTAEDIDTANAILDLSCKSRIPTPEPLKTEIPTPQTKVAYTYEAFHASDGRAKKARPRHRYACDDCGRTYATSSNLSRHKQTHQSQKDAANVKACHVCGKEYFSRPALAMHLLTHNRKHACNICNKAFSRPWLLKGHMRSHTGDRPYGCAHCGKAFADRSNLRAHMQIHAEGRKSTHNLANVSLPLSPCYSPPPASVTSDSGVSSCSVDI